MAALSERLVLNQFLLRELGFEDFDELAAPLRNDPELELVDADGVSRYHRALAEAIPDEATLNSATLLAYDLAIQRHTAAISDRRAEPIRWRYFQYLTLLFSERFLDRCFIDPEALRADLNVHVDRFNRTCATTDRVLPYQLRDLRKLAFWSATGSGKTLLMHVNLLQYRDHLEKHNRKGDVNRTILLTPNEGLSRQHLVELQRSGIESEIFLKDSGGLFQRQSVEIIDIHKLRGEEGDKTVAIDSFERNNLVLVDEGHRGAGGNAWMGYRDQLCEDGFSFEYSATFGQALAGERHLSRQYAKWIVFDYAYRRFHHDGYGKDYRILNLPHEGDEATRRTYLTAALLSFYQQRRLYDDREEELAPFSIERPLWVFVGSSVNAKVVQTQRGAKVSDVLDILLVLARILADPQETIDALDLLLDGESGLLDETGAELFADAFPYLRDVGINGEAAYRDILQRVFNCSGPGPLRVVLRRAVDGEIELRVGDSDPFGVVSVGDAASLHKLCDEHEELLLSETIDPQALFDSIDDAESSVNVLIGAKKFIEGWSSWRVSSLGLMRVGQNEGTQIIQLFGRGVRLKGHGFGLKRSRAIVPALEHVPKHLELLETLTVFGVRANYMAEFRRHLEEEGAPVDTMVEVIVPVRRAERWPEGLKTIRLDPAANYRAQQRTTLRVREEAGPSPVVVDWFPRVQALASAGATQAAIFEKPSHRLRPDHVAFLDRDRLYRELVRFKRERGFHNLVITRDAIDQLLDCSDWYELLVPPERLHKDAFSRVSEWEEMALALLKAWCERLYKHDRGRWESRRLEYQTVDPDDRNIIDSYSVSVPAADDELLRQVEHLRDAVRSGDFEAGRAGGFEIFDLAQHLYRPLGAMGTDGTVIVKPQPLNDGERRFLKDLREWTLTRAGQAMLAQSDLHVLRNLSRGRGVGFFEAGNFYPDFIVWLAAGDHQHLLFVDPKGIQWLGSLDHDKIRFRHTIKSIERRLDDPNVTLSAFIVSSTLFSEIHWAGERSKDEFEAEHVLFQQDDSATYISDMFRRAHSETGAPHG